MQAWLSSVNSAFLNELVSSHVDIHRERENKHYNILFHMTNVEKLGDSSGSWTLQQDSGRVGKDSRCLY